jgi:excisionase family DNA binding protein/putative nucleotidyltransferase with HDIG domain
MLHGGSGMKEFPSRQADMVNVREAAKILGVSTQTVKNYIYRGKLRSYRTPGGHYRIRHEDLTTLGFLDLRPSREELVESYNDLYDSYTNTLRCLTSALDARDGISTGHSRRVANYVVSLAEVMGISREEQETIKLAGLLHDVGKVLVSERILSKPGKLTDQEYHLIRQHPEMGEKIVSEVEVLETAKAPIRHHHERFDGKGYPDGLSGDEIPLGARMISVAEAFDCVTCECAFQRRRRLDEAVNELERNAGTQFDPEIVRIFVEEVVSNLRDRDGEQYGITYVFREGEGAEGFRHSGGSG